jgi:hypothetical protein
MVIVGILIDVNVYVRSKPVTLILFGTKINVNVYVMNITVIPHLNNGLGIYVLVSHVNKKNALQIIIGIQTLVNVNVKNNNVRKIIIGTKINVNVFANNNNTVKIMKYGIRINVDAFLALLKNVNQTNFGIQIPVNVNAILSNKIVYLLIFGILINVHVFVQMKNHALS